MTILEIKDIKVKINILLIALLIFYCYLGYNIKIIISFIFVIIHEFTHIFIATKLGIKFNEIELFPFGGVAKSDSIIGTDTRAEIIVSIAGPLINFIFGLMFFITNTLFYSSETLIFIYSINFLLAIFNILPILPLDGGRIVRAFLSSFWGFKRVTHTMVNISYLISGIIFSYGVYVFLMEKQGVYLMLISSFIFVAAKKEKEMVAFIFIKEILGKKNLLLKQKAMNGEIIVVLKDTTIKEALEYFLPKRYHILYIINKDGDCVGLINENEFIKYTIEYGIDISLNDLLIRIKK
ncbi:M50 family metallopeptidase [Dethiothermospora halolimnae]|uniref:M50 family metallopeptidase n=1 Tax=Dethiothermospora halolimnae TaxID=3114390 RepID=UPI003CCBB2DD